MADNFGLNDVSKIKGLSEAEAAEKLARDGYNEIPSAKKRSFWAIAWGVIREPMLLLLIGGGIIYMILGDVREALMLLAFVFVIIGITLYQERRTERTLEALRDLSSPRAMVIRDGATKRIAGREVVRGDIIVLSEGDRVPADGVILAGNNLTVEESILTGESMPVRKIEDETCYEMSRPGGDNSPCVYSGTLVVSGLGIARILATGIHSEFGKIGKSLQKIEPEDTLLQKETRTLVRNLAVIGLGLSALVAILYGLLIGNWLEGLLASITLAMAILPEEFPVVLTIFLALGAWRISQSHVLTRRMPAIETLGATTVLCVDKTGTLTMNRMSVEKIYAAGEFFNINLNSLAAPPEKFHSLVEFSILASQTNPFDPMEKALKELGDRYQSLTEHLHSDWGLMREYPLSKQLLALSRVWKSPTREEYIIAAKGAPEAIFDLCHLSETEINRLSERIDTMAADGLRVLGVARAHFEPASLPGDQHEFTFNFLGLVGFADPVRQTVPDSIKECYQAGIRVVMITGDYPITARHIARQIGLNPSEGVITGPELHELSDEELRKRIKDVNIFARVVPEQKLRLVDAFKANGEIVAMTGDGVNDAPALKSANIGVAMGGRGTDVAREAGALVLLDDDFSSIVKAVGLGRRIFDNLRKAMAYILAVHVPIAGLSLIPVILKWPLVLMPVHVLFLELIIDPASSIAFEAEQQEADIMRRPPRHPKEPIFNRRTAVKSVLQGIGVLAVTLAIYGYNIQTGRGEFEARTLTFVTLVLANLGLILCNRFRKNTFIGVFTSKNVTVRWIIAATLVFLALVVYIPALRDVFDFALLHPLDWAFCFGAGLLCVLWFELTKLFSRQKANKLVSN
ncbi:MAG: cation-translocating P-type ATPase [Dehalococcoidales bacterium]|nr:cation-translocating P-type ATPase [Dehalococcoidales bacterium]